MFVVKVELICIDMQKKEKISLAVNEIIAKLCPKKPNSWNDRKERIITAIKQIEQCLIKRKYIDYKAIEFANGLKRYTLILRFPASFAMLILQHNFSLTKNPVRKKVVNVVKGKKVLSSFEKEVFGEGYSGLNY